MNKFELVISHAPPQPTWGPTYLHGDPHPFLHIFKLVHFGKRVVGLRLKGLLVSKMFSKETRFLIREQMNRFSGLPV